HTIKFNQVASFHHSTPFQILMMLTKQNILFLIIFQIVYINKCHLNFLSVPIEMLPEISKVKLLVSLILPIQESFDMFI
ncbi:MAG TPA: hypothetical protein VK135_03465, partial [Candidatus Dormibacteraeota bacterium]|nr:hypothetical protein [Candidatus Dormibacteraeota bacterium]